MISAQTPGIPYIRDDQSDVESTNVAALMNEANAFQEPLVHVAEGRLIG